jgi:hypothetical protein
MQKIQRKTAILQAAHLACEDVNPERRLIVYPGTESFPLKDGVEVKSLDALAKALADLA